MNSIIHEELSGVLVALKWHWTKKDKLQSRENGILYYKWAQLHSWWTTINQHHVSFPMSRDMQNNAWLKHIHPIIAWTWLYKLLWKVLWKDVGEGKWRVCLWAPFSSVVFSTQFRSVLPFNLYCLPCFVTSFSKLTPDSTLPCHSKKIFISTDVFDEISGAPKNTPRTPQQGV